MGAGGIINKQAAVLLVAVTDSCMYDLLSDDDKAAVDAIDAKDPLSRTQDDVNTLCAVLSRATSN